MAESRMTPEEQESYFLDFMDDPNNENVWKPKREQGIHDYLYYQLRVWICPKLIKRLKNGLTKVQSGIKKFNKRYNIEPYQTKD